jgi:hypothetical protein
MENPTTIAVDLSKNVFEIAVERQGRICQSSSKALYFCTGSGPRG